MLTAEGCRGRRERLWREMDPPPGTDYLLLTDPLHLAYLANFWVDPISSSANYHGYLLVRKDGYAKLLYDNRIPKSSQQVAHADERRVVPWYDGQTPGRCPRQLAVLPEVNPDRGGLRVHDRPGDPLASQVINTIARMRRQKDPDEVDLMRRCMAATDAGHAWARAHLRAGMTELDAYNGVHAACVRAAGMPVVVYGDFAVCTGPDRRGGSPTDRVLHAGDLFILDYSVVIQGYRSDLTNTIAIGGAPTPEQERLFRLCTQAMAAGEKALQAGTACQTVYDAVRGVFEDAGVADLFPHHAGHGLGLGHPEPPYLVRHSTESLLEGDIVTLEPGLYLAGHGGVRIENNYLITALGYEQMSHHTIALV
jgi:Xaa-Pro dipeptidase